MSQTNPTSNSVALLVKCMRSMADLASHKEPAISEALIDGVVQIERLTRAAAEVEMMALTLEARDKEIERLTRENAELLGNHQRHMDVYEKITAERDRLHETVLTEGKKLELADVEIERLTGELGERERLRAMIAERELATRYERNRLRAALEFWMALGHLETYESREAFRKDARELLSGEHPPSETAGKPTHRQVVFNWLMAEPNFATKPDGYWGGSEEVARVDALLVALGIQRTAVKASEQRIPEGWCPVCGGQNGEHKPGCEPAPGDIV